MPKELEPGGLLRPVSSLHMRAYLSSGNFTQHACSMVGYTCVRKMLVGGFFFFFDFFRICVVEKRGGPDPLDPPSESAPDTIPCHAMPCHAMPCHAMPWHAMPCHAMPCHTIPYHTILCWPTSSNQLKVMLCNSADCRYRSSSPIYVQAKITSVSFGSGLYCIDSTFALQSCVYTQASLVPLPHRATP